MGVSTKRLGPGLARRTGYREIPTLTHWCPACGEAHDFAVEQPFRNGAQWTYDGNSAAPTFTPSMNIAWGPDSKGVVYRCHYFLRAGEIQFLEDCTHSMAGQTVPLPDLPAEMLVRWGM